MDKPPTMLRDMEIADRVRRNSGPQDEATLLSVECMTHLLKTFSIVQDRLNRMLEPDKLTLAKFNLLIVLRNAPDKQLPMSEIGERMSVTCANITKLVDGLVRDGWVKRRSLPADRRVVLAVVTPEGEELLHRILRQHCANIAHLWGDMDADDCLLLIHLLLKLRQNVARAEPPKSSSCEPPP